MDKLLRFVAAAIFLVITFAAIMSLHNDESKEWYDWVSNAPLLYMLASLAFFRSDSALFSELNGILEKLKQVLAKIKK